ncbi:MAG TPA: tyrosine--tRNA ligase [Candidatus Stercoripulliclostridium merdigallinarum]|uniref:Tyrosine--tRNA ligase n=1 Tax=Candidatus Stercoripulliclostridium merdigallinarum TaxID=2840951 RepID=A0A9D1SI61_9FIRM|nr:tyrosine--tRNA ligase [Candidatus Stercoripulliclostridium merdigallinarum]
MPTNKNVIDTLTERGFIKQTVYGDELYELLGKQSVPFYVGFDPTADSLHVGHFLVLMAMAHMQRAGHKPIVLLGGGTGMVGDPSGRTDMRSMMTKETIAHNVACFRQQMSRFLSFEGENAAVMVDNGEWLLSLNYIDFLREVGSVFTVNRMLTAECFKNRMEKGLSFLEFNYMLMQAYDFLVLYRKYGVVLECGGDDQWSNMLAGVDLIRRKEQAPAYAMTFSLLLTSEGKKMGKTMNGAVWLDKNKTSPYDFYQYWRNIDDNDVEKCMGFLTFMPMDEIKQMTSCYTVDENGVKHFDGAINAAKARLAYEVTKIVHGEEEADKARRQAEGAFGGGDEMPEAAISATTVKVADMLVELGLAKSKGEAKRLIEGGGIRLNDDKVASFDADIPSALLETGFVLHKGKKQHIKISVK